MIACICEILACLIALTTISHSLEGFSGYEYLLWSAFHFCLELALETWAKATLNNSLGVHDLDDTLTTLSHQWVLNCQGLSTSKRSSWQKTAHSAQNGAPKREEERFLCHFVLKRREIAKPVLTKACLQPAMTANTCTACRDCVCPPPPIPHFLLVQTLSSKQIAQTDKHVAKVA